MTFKELSIEQKNGIKNYARLDKRLLPEQKLLFETIVELIENSADNTCFCNDSYFQHKFEKGRRTISRWLKQLEDFGYITRDTDHTRATKQRRRISLNLDTLLPKLEARKRLPETELIKDSFCLSELSEQSREVWLNKLKEAEDNVKEREARFNDGDPCPLVGECEYMGFSPFVPYSNPNVSEYCVHGLTQAELFEKAHDGFTNIVLDDLGYIIAFKFVLPF